jgi:hypothetical protein
MANWRCQPGYPRVHSGVGRRGLPVPGPRDGGRRKTGSPRKCSPGIRTAECAPFSERHGVRPLPHQTAMKSWPPRVSHWAGYHAADLGGPLLTGIDPACNPEHFAYNGR